MSVKHKLYFGDMKYVVIIALSLFVVISVAAFSLSTSSPAGDHAFWKTWDKAYPAAVSQKRIVLIDFYTDWCGWCKRMDADTYSQPEVQEVIKKYYEPVKLNPEKAGITYQYKGRNYNGEELKAVLAQMSGGGFGGYPTTGFLVPSASGDIVVLQPGYLKPAQFVQLLNDLHQKVKPSMK
jgi:thioredoxin-related protein